MIQLTEQYILENYFESIINRGRKYFDDGRVEELIQLNNYNSWYARVRGSYVYSLTVIIKEYEDGIAVKANCACTAYEVYGECKHIVAALYAILHNNSGVSNLITLDESFIYAFSNLAYDEAVFIDKDQMKVEYLLKINYDGKLTLEMKAGIAHRYVIKNIREFLINVLEYNEHYFTHKFTYDVNEHYFLDEDLNIFRLLYNIIQTGDLFTDRNYYINNAYDRRELLIPTLNVSEILFLLVERNLKASFKDKVYSPVHVIKNDVPFKLEIDNNDNQLQVNILANDTIEYLEHYDLVFSEGIFYFPNKYQTEMTKQLKYYGFNNRRFAIKNSDKDSFFSVALPSLKKVTDIKIADTVSNEIAEYPLRAKLYITQEDNSIIGELEYNYGPYSINPFTNDVDSERIIIRDVEKENLIMNYIEQAKFHFNGEKLYINIENDEDIFDFLYLILPVLEEHLELYLTREIKSMIVDYEPYASTSVNIQSDTNLLEIGFDISGVNEEEVSNILEAIIEKKRFYRVNNGEFISLENDEFRSIQNIFAELAIKKGDLTADSFTLPIHKGLQLDELIETGKEYKPSFRRLLNRLKSPADQTYELPTNLNASLRAYQEVGFQWFKSLSEYHLGGILADDMGLGKTLQTIAYILSESDDNKPHLVIVPSSVVYNWSNECAKFAPSLKTAIISGQKEEREEIIANADSADVWITSYGTLRQDINLYHDKSFKTLILDEAQYVKNYATKTSQAVRQIKAENRFALSGTPIENSLTELWSIFEVILPNFLPNQREFRQMSTDKIVKMIKPFILRRLKGDVLKELPEKIETVQMSELTEDQKKLYVGYLQQLQTEVKQSFQANNFHNDRMKILAGLTRLRQLCCHPGLFIDNYVGSSGKLAQLMETIETLLANNKRMLIFSQFTSMHEIIIEELTKQGIDYFYLHGQTKSEARVKMTEAFNAGEKDVFLISLRAGGTGLNLTGADTVILYDLWWNPAVEDQAASRAHRFGQKNVVQVIRLITEGTIEEKIYELQQKKRELFDKVIQPGETMLNTLSEEDIKSLLSL